jgi:hypothetical protein
MRPTDNPELGCSLFGALSGKGCKSPRGVPVSGIGDQIISKRVEDSHRYSARFLESNVARLALKVLALIYIWSFFGLFAP